MMMICTLSVCLRMMMSCTHYRVYIYIYDVELLYPILLINNIFQLIVDLSRAGKSD